MMIKGPKMVCVNKALHQVKWFARYFQLPVIISAQRNLPVAHRVFVLIAPVSRKERITTDGSYG